MHSKEILYGGKKLEEAKKVLIMVHGRGGSAEDIMGLAEHLQTSDYALIAPQATNNTWYPYSFLENPKDNEPWLNSALQLIKSIVEEVEAKGIDKSNIYFLGFSQGACLMLEYVARNASKYGGVNALTGGLIGDKIYSENYKGDFEGTPVFIGSSDPDPHVPVHRVHESVNIFREMNASVTEKIYLNMGHTINDEEINLANELVFGD